MNILYVVVGEQGEYDDYSKENICASLDKSVAENKMRELIEQQSRYNTNFHLVNNFRQQWEREYLRKNSCPTSPCQPWKGNTPSKLNLEERAKYDSFIDKQNELLKEFKILEVEFYKQKSRTLQLDLVNYLKNELKIVNEEEIQYYCNHYSNYYNDVKYSVEELELI